MKNALTAKFTYPVPPIASKLVKTPILSVTEVVFLDVDVRMKPLFGMKEDASFSQAVLLS